MPLSCLNFITLRRVDTILIAHYILDLRVLSAGWKAHSFEMSEQQQEEEEEEGEGEDRTTFSTISSEIEEMQVMSTVNSESRLGNV